YQTSKYDANGDLKWTAYYDESSDDLPTAIAIDDAGNVYVTGRSLRSDGGYDTATVKYVQQQSPPPLPPRLESPAGFAAGQFRCALVGEPGRFYTIQASLDLLNWFTLTNFVSATGINPITGYGSTRSNEFSRAFYRAVTR